MGLVRNVLFIIAALIILGVSSCMGDDLMSDSEISDYLLEYLEEKYNGQEFVPIRFGNDYIFRCYPKGGDPEADLVKVKMRSYKKEDPNREIRDDYFGIFIREDAEADIANVLSDFELPMKIYYNRSGWYDNIWDGTKTYAEYKAWRNENGKRNMMDFDICVFADGLDISEKEDYANQVFKILKENDYSGLMCVMFYPSEALENANRINIYQLADEYSDYYDNLSESI